MSQETYIHDSGIIDAVNDDLFDSCFFECVLRFQVSWNLSVGSIIVVVGGLSRILC